MSSHTPGPWEADSERRGHVVWARGPTGSMLVATCGHAAFDGANARLIAAAPDLLAALKAMFADACDCGPDVHCRSCELGLRAIAKAEGRP